MSLQYTLEQAQQNNQKALTKLIRLVSDKIFTISTYYLADFHLAQDATQEILLKIMQKLNQVERAATFENWSYTLASNYLKNYLRDNKKLRNISFDMMEQDNKTHLDFNLPETNEAEKIRELAYELKVSCTSAMLMCLEKEDRIIFILSNLLNLKSSQIGKMLHMKPELARKRLSRGKEKLMNFVENNCGLINKSSSCHCKERLPYAIHMGRVSADQAIHTSPTYVENEQALLRKIDEMEELEDMAALFANNPEYKLPDSIMNRVMDIAER